MRKLVASRSTLGNLCESSADIGSGSLTRKALRPLEWGAWMVDDFRRSLRYAVGGMSRSSIGMSWASPLIVDTGVVTCS